MIGSDFALKTYRRQVGTSNFKGTLIGIVVSFFILIFFTFLLNLVEGYWHLNIYNKSAVTEDGGMAGEKVSDFLSFHSLLGIKVANAATREDYKATLLLRSASKLELAPGEDIVYRVGFKNIGNTAWHNNDRNFISIYTYSPKYRSSSFHGSGWYKYNQPAKLNEQTVNVGALGFIEFKLKAPQILGNYTEFFYLAAEDKTWIEGGLFSVPIVVTNNKKVVAKTSIIAPAQAVSSIIAPITNPIKADVKSIVNSNYGASLLLASHKQINAKAGEVVDLHFGFKNTGQEAWDLKGLVIPDEDLLADGNSIFYVPTWTSGHQATVVSGSRTLTGQLALLDAKMQVPETSGTYTLKLKLVTNYDKMVSGGEIEIPVYVTDEPVISSSESGQITNLLNKTEPILDIGLYFLENNNEAVELTANTDYRIINKSGATLANLNSNESVRVQYDFSNKIFTVQNARWNFTAPGLGELHFAGAEQDSIFTILSMSRSGAYGYNYNKYRDGIILRQAQNTERLWVINRLPMEHYLWGIAETSNLSDLDYIKSIIVAARTYGVYQYEANTKYSGYFHMRATTADQLYQGYVSEIQRSRVVQAVGETKGEVVTYNNDIVLTPYFGHSDGRTRSYTEVWGDIAKPWLMSVPVPSDVGRTLWGHGVGMSAKGAYHNAQTDGWDYAQILKYYYTGIEVSRVY